MRLQDLTGIQGELKQLSKDAYAKLRMSIEKHGIRFPLFVWAGHNRIIDGHYRLLVLDKMRQEGWQIPPVPVVEVEAADERHAKELVLLATSQYAKVTQDGLYAFIQQAELPLEVIKAEVAIPEVNIGWFEQGFYSDSLLDKLAVQDAEAEEKKEAGATTHTCPQCGYVWQS